MIKKITSIICAFCLILSLFSMLTALSAAASDDEPNYSVNDFETDNRLQGGTWYTEETVADFDSANVHGGIGSLRYTYKQSAWQTYESAMTLEAGKTYQVSFWYKMSYDGGCPFYYNLKSLGSGSNCQWGSKSTVWTRRTQTYTPTKDDKFVIQIYSKDAGGPLAGSFIYIDDIVITEVFSMSVNQAENGTASVDKQKPVSGDTVTFTATPNAGYLFEKWVDESGNKVADQKTYVVSNISKSLALTPVFVEDTGCNGIIDFETPNAIVSGASATGKWYTDTVDGYDASNVHSGTKSYYNTYPNTAWNSDITIDYTLQSGKTYKISLWYKGSLQLGFMFNGSELGNQQIYQSSGDTWKQKTFEYKATADTTLKLRKYCNSGTFYGKTFYLDDIVITEVFSMSVNQAENGTATVDKSGAATGDTVTFTATPNAGYLFEKWVDESGNKVADQKTYVVSNISKSLALTPVFVEDTGCNGIIDFETPNAIVSGASATGKWYTDTVDGYDASNVHSGTKSYYNTYPNSEWNSDITIDYTLQAGKTYKISLWYKGSLQLGFMFNGTELAAQQIWQSSGDTWKQKTFEYKATADTTLKLRKYCISGTFYGKTFYLDDIEIKELMTYNVSANYAIADYITFPSSSLEGKEITVVAKQYIDGNKVFYGWEKGDKIESMSLQRDLVITEDTELGEDNIGVPVYVDLGDCNNDGNIDILDLVHIKNLINDKLSENASDIDFDGDVDDDDLHLLRQRLLGKVELSVPKEKLFFQ